MTLPLVFHHGVADEVDDAYRFYESRSEGLGDDFLAAVEEVYRRIANTPLMHRKVSKKFDAVCAGDFHTPFSIVPILIAWK